MIDLGATPTFLMGDDYLEAPASEPTILGGWDRRPAHSLAELLDTWHDATWGGEA